MRMKLSLFASFGIGLAALATAAFVGCSSSDHGALDTDADGGDAGGHDASQSSDASPSDAASDGGTCVLVSPYSSKNEVCNDCAQAECCVEINGCLGDTVCNDDYVDCLLACALDPGDGGDAGVATCEAACDAQYPKGKSEYDIAIGCAEQKCATQCQ